MNCSCSAHGSFLTAKGLAEAEQRRAGSVEIPGVDMGQLSLYFDKVGSVSGSPSPEVHWECDHLLEEQYRRFHNGS